MTSNQTLKGRANRELEKLGTRHKEIPLDEIFAIVEKHLGMVVDEDGQKWEGWLLGGEGYTSFKIEGQRRIALHLSWTKIYFTTGPKFEIIVWVS